MAEQYSGITWTVTELLAEVREEARVPDNARTDAQILTEATTAIWSELQSPLLLGLGESAYGVRTLDLLDSGALGRDSNEYVLPSHCTAETISHVEYYDTLTSDTPVRLSNNPLQMATDHYRNGQQDTGTPAWWSFRSGRVVAYPAAASSSTGYLRVFYQRRHPKLLVSTNNVTYIEAVDTDNSTFTLPSIPTGWPSFDGEGADPAAVDIFSMYGPHRYYVTDLVIDDDSADPTVGYVDQVDVTPMTEVPTNSNAYVSLAGTSDRIHLPPELRKPLNLRVASYLLRQIGDEARANSMLGEYRAMLQDIRNQLAPRAKNAPQRVINPNSPLRGGRGSRGRYR